MSEPALIEAVRDEVKSRRERVGISQQELADRCDVSKSFISKVELGMHLPTIGVFLDLAVALEVSPNELLAGVLLKREMARRRRRR